MNDVDRSTQRRTARLVYLAVVLVAALLLYFVIGDKRLYAAALPPLLLITGYRSWNVERLSPALAQFYAHTVVSGAADRMLPTLRSDPWLRDAWAAAGAPLHRLTPLPDEWITVAMRTLGAAGPGVRPMSAPARAADRGAAVLLGLLLGGALGWSGLPVSWPVLVALALIAAFRWFVAFRNRGQLAVVAAAMRANPRSELAALLAPPWTGRREAVVQELHRLAEHAEQGPPPRRMPELRRIELLLAAGIAAGLLVGRLI